MKLLRTVIMGMFVLAVVLIVASMVMTSIECADKGYLYVRTISGFACIEAKEIK